MTEGDQDQSGVAVAVSSLPRRFRQLLDFGRRRYSRVRSSAFGGLTAVARRGATATDRFSLLGVTKRSVAFIGAFSSPGGDYLTV